VSTEPIAADEFAALMAPLGPFAFPVLVGCSGGPDSLALAWLAHRWSGGRAVAVVVDHRLRPESTAEAAGVVAQLAERGIRAEGRRVDIAPGAALQARARAERRAALLAACRAHGAVHLLLAHHAEDQGETVLFRALRGSGVRGLAGMASVTLAEEALILRPLLSTPRARLAATCAAAGLAPTQDPSNADPRFARARLRAAAPATPAAHAARAFAARRARRDAALAERAAGCLSLRPEGCARLDLAALGEDAVAQDLLAAVLLAVGGGARRPTAAAVARLLAAGQGTLGGARLLASGWVVREEPTGWAPAEAGACWDGRFRLAALRPGAMVGPLGRAAAARLRARHRHLPAAALAALPVVHEPGDGSARGVPHLQAAVEDGRSPAAARFAPLGGPVTGS
jgi:tRNA(Ile)-lysidine synthase